MRADIQALPLGFPRAIRIVTALVAMLQVLLVAAAPLAEQPDSRVAAVHVEQAGTRVHHAHGELCATCVAIHLLWTPPRATVAAIATQLHARPQTDQPSARRWIGLTVLLPRAPPV
jgi:hypothetical protein